MICSAKNKEGNPCEMSALKGEQFCISHSNSERARKSKLRQAKNCGRFDKNGHLTLRGFWLDLKWAREKLMTDTKTTMLQKAGTLKMLDVRILKLQQMMKKQKPKKVKKLPSGTQLIRKVEGKIVKEVA